MNPFPADSSALWIAAPWQGGPRSSAIVPYLRTLFRVGQPIVSARLSLTALGVYQAYINGVLVSDEVLSPGWTDYRRRVQFQSFEVGHLLRDGENVLGAELGDGWYCGFMAWENRQTYGEKPWLRALLTLTFADGSRQDIPTDGTWQAHVSPTLESDIIMGECYDARLEIPGWAEPCTDVQEGWQAVVTAGTSDFGCDIVPRLGPPVRRIQEIEPVNVREFVDGPGHKGVVIDFGQNFCGRARLRVQAPRGTTLRLRYAEVLDDNGNLYVDNLRSARVTDAYTCKGVPEGEWETWEPRFTFHGFRYMDVIGLTEHDAVEATGIVLHSEMAQTGTFLCSNPLLNQLQSNILWGQKSNFLEVPTDCPQRDERLGWTGDAQVFVRTAAFNMDVRLFFAKWLQDLRDAQRPNGAQPFVAPMPGYFRHIPHEDGGPAWSDATFVCPWTIYECYGDEQILRDHYAAMQAHMDFIANHRSKDHIRSVPEVDPWGGFGDWLALDGSGSLEGGTPKPLIATALYANDARIMERTATVLGHADDARHYRQLHAHIRDAFIRAFTDDDGLLPAATQTAYALALCLDLLPESVRVRAGEELVALIRANGNHLATGFVGTPYLLSALESSGHTDVAYQLLEQEEFPSWLFPVKNGATTIWERWNGWTPENGFQDKAMNSFNHYAYGAVGAWMYQRVAGITPDPQEPGYRHIIFRPTPGGSLSWAEATLQTAHGTVSIRWDLNTANDTLAVSLAIPPGTHGTLWLPDGFTDSNDDTDDESGTDAARKDLPPGEHRFVFRREQSPASLSC